MRQFVFETLYKNINAFVSGETLSNQLNVSRAAISKHISAMRADGAIIESVSHNGHRMTHLPDRLKEVYVLPLLNNNALISTYRWFEEVGSTNDALKKDADGLDEISIYVCEDQVSGKGRRGRTWISNKYKGIYVSFLLKPDLKASEGFQITCLAAVAQVKTIRQVCNLDALIKWPNDIIIHDKKVSGTLSEMSSDFDGINHIICGIGLNVNHTSECFEGELIKKATSLKMESQQNIDRLVFFTTFIDTFTSLYDNYKKNGTSAYIDEYRNFSAVIGKPVMIESGNKSIQGIVKDIDDAGAIMLETSNGIQRIIAGEISLRGLNGYV